MTTSNKEAKKTINPGNAARRLIVGLMAIGVLLAVVWTVAGGAPRVTLMLWGVGETVLPWWDKVDPTAPRVPSMPDDAVPPKDVDAKGKALRATIDSFYLTLPETTKSFLEELLSPPYQGPAIDVSKIARHYIPAGTSFVDAERILQAAGMSIVWPPRTASERVPPIPGKPTKDYPVQATREQSTANPAAYMRFYVWLLPQNPGDYGDNSPVGKVTAVLNRQFEAPTPPVSFEFDASRTSALADATIKIVKGQFYQFNLVFRGSSPVDMRGIGKLAGDGATYPDGRYAEPGIIVPIHVVVTNKNQETIYDRTADTQGISSFSYLKINRSAGGVTLGPGLYRIRVNATKEIPELSNTKIEFSVTYDSRL